MTIEPLRATDVDDVVALHRDALGGLLARLGSATVRAHYRNALAGHALLGFVARDGGRIVGFVAGSQRPDAVRRDALARGPLRVAAALLAATVHAPRAVATLLADQWRIASPRFDATAPEVTYVAVAATARGRGVAGALMDAFEDALRDAGAEGVELSVEADNHAAVRLYEARGYVRVADYEEFGACYRRYRKPLAGDGRRSSSVEVPARDVRVLGRFLRYVAAGVFATAIYFAAVAVLVELVRWPPVTAAIGATVVVVVTSYLVNRAWIFDTDRTHASAFARFVVASLLGIAINAGMMALAVDGLRWPYLAGALLATLVMPPLNFALNYLWAFRAASR